MKRLLFLVPFLATAPLLADNYWEVGVFGGAQKFSSPTLDLSEGNRSLASFSSDTGTKAVFGLRASRSVYEFGLGNLMVSALWQPAVTTTSTLSGTTIFVPGQATGSIQIKDGQYGFGAMVNFKTLVHFGAGLDYRVDQLRFLDGTASTTYSRPWLRANVLWQIPTPGIRPFVGLEAAAALTNTNGEVQDQAAYLKGFAPSAQLLLFAGIRF